MREWWRLCKHASKRDSETFWRLFGVLIFGLSDQTAREEVKLSEPKKVEVLPRLRDLVTDTIDV